MSIEARAAPQSTSIKLPALPTMTHSRALDAAHAQASPEHLTSEQLCGELPCSGSNRLALVL